MCIKPSKYYPSPKRSSSLLKFAKMNIFVYVVSVHLKLNCVVQDNNMILGQMVWWYILQFGSSFLFEISRLHIASHLFEEKNWWNAGHWKIPLLWPWLSVVWSSSELDSSLGFIISFINLHALIIFKGV